MPGEQQFDKLLEAPSVQSISVLAEGITDIVKQFNSLRINSDAKYVSLSSSFQLVTDLSRILFCRRSTDVAIREKQTELINSFVSCSYTFQDGLKSGVVVAAKGRSVSREYIFFLEEGKGGNLDSDDARELIGDMKSRVGELVDATQTMVDTFSSVGTELKKVRLAL